MDITGTLKVINDTKQVSDRFKSREFVLTDNSSQYPQHISFQLTQDKCDLLNGKAIGTEVKVHFNLRGREWNSPTGETKYFNSLEAWRLEFGVVDTDKDGSKSVSQFQQADDSDLPF
jgi:hypothetical protein